MALIEIEDLRVEFGAETAPAIAVDGVDLALDAGEVVGCVGESGSGNSPGVYEPGALPLPVGISLRFRMRSAGRSSARIWR